MHRLRWYLSWVFAFTCLVCLQIGLSQTLAGIRQQYHFHSVYGSWSRLLLFAAPLMMITFAIVFGMAWWTVFKQRSSARGWGIAASLINIQLSLLPVVVPPHSIWNGFSLVLAVGVTGLIAFIPKLKQGGPSEDAMGHTAPPGDGTSRFINKVAEILALALFVGAYQWWIGWHRAKGIWIDENFWDQTAISLLFAFILITFHEVGHTAAGIALGMKLRSFIVGPFQWHLRDGRWCFEFKPKEILVGGGKTGIVPTCTDFPRWASLCMIAAGPAANLASGLLTFYAISAGEFGLSQHAQALLGWFGAWSLVMGVANLVPVRTRRGYSDGAQIYQLLSNGPWADLHYIVSLGGATLVTPLRPRDYDIKRILRVEHSIPRGIYGFALRIYAYAYLFDHARLHEAGEAIKEAALIYEDCAAEVTAEVHTVLVFASAYIHHDATAARQWWTRMEAKKPTLNVDYWLAASALDWIEGNTVDAKLACEKANTLAQQLPRAGAYEFDRDCCSLLKRVLDESLSTSAGA